MRSSKRWGAYMNTFEKILSVLGKNLAYTIVLVIAVIFFAYFSDGLIPGLITAFSALIAYVCGAGLYREFKIAFSGKKTVSATVKKSPAKKTGAKKTSKK